MIQSLIELPVFPYSVHKDRLQITDRRLGTVDATQTSIMISSDVITSIQEYECVFVETNMKMIKARPENTSKEIRIKFCCINTLTASIYTLLDKESLLKLIKESEDKRWYNLGTTCNPSERNIDSTIENVKKAQEAIEKAKQDIIKERVMEVYKLETNPPVVINKDELFE